jgi:hypothetical protein
VRDCGWATLKPDVEPVEVNATNDSLRLRLEAQVVAEEMDLAWTAEIEACASGRLNYRWRAKAAGDSTTNRAGLCVLHPAEAAGSPCVVEHTDARREAGWFPRDVSPHQPFCDIRAVTQFIGERSEVVVRMEGEVFEMEDQRNWTDASFKTYSRPLAWPRPYQLRAGVEIEQSVTVEVRGKLSPTEVFAAPVELGSGRSPVKLPGIGFTLPGPIPSALRDRLRALRPAHVRVETNSANLAATLDWAVVEAAFLNCPLVLAIRGAERNAPDPSRFPARYGVHLFDIEGNSVCKETVAAWRQAGHAQIATGTLHHFSELNRNRPPADGAHTLTVFGINAQVHASDDDSILETLTQHSVVARAVRSVGALRPVAVAPISLGRHADASDERLHTEFGAEWLLGSLTRLAAAEGVQSVTYFHSHGPAGFMRADAVTPIERLLLSLAGCDTLPSKFSIPT